MSLRRAAELGGREALAAFGLPSTVPKPPSLGSIGVKMPEMKGMPKPGSSSTPGTMGGVPGAGKQADVLDHLKLGFNVGIGASNMSTGGTGSVAGEPADEGRRQRSVIDRTLQENDNSFATSDSPMPGATVSP